jgi:putative transposase
MPQHVIQRGNNRAAIFARDADYEFYRECLVVACARYECRVHAYAFMTNHTHLLITPSEPGGISMVMQSVGRRFVRYFNDAYGRTGTLWEGRHKATLVECERYLFACYRYIELNPVRAGLVEKPGDYRWSSHRANAFGTRDPLVTPHPQYRELGVNASARRAAYRAFFGAELDEDLIAEIRSATNTGWALGSSRFRADIGRLLARRARPQRVLRSATRD